MADPIKRDEKGGRDATTGRFVPGYKGGGRRAIDPEVREILTAATPDAARRLIDALDAERPVVVGNGAHATVEYVTDHDMRIKAANAILDRVYGKPTQAITGEDGEPLRIDIGVVDILKKLAAP